MSGAMGFPAVDEAVASFGLVVGVEEGDETEHSAGVCSPPSVSGLRFETEPDTGNMEHGHGMFDMLRSRASDRSCSGEADRDGLSGIE